MEMNSDENIVVCVLPLPSAGETSTNNISSTSQAFNWKKLNVQMSSYDMCTFNILKCSSHWEKIVILRTDRWKIETCFFTVKSLIFYSSLFQICEKPFATVVNIATFWLHNAIKNISAL